MRDGFVDATLGPTLPSVDGVLAHNALMERLKRENAEREHDALEEHNREVMAREAERDRLANGGLTVDQRVQAEKRKRLELLAKLGEERRGRSLAEIASAPDQRTAAKKALKTAQADLSEKEAALARAEAARTAGKAEVAAQERAANDAEAALAHAAKLEAIGEAVDLRALTSARASAREALQTAQAMLAPREAAVASFHAEARSAQQAAHMASRELRIAEATAERSRLAGLLAPIVAQVRGLLPELDACELGAREADPRYSVRDALVSEITTLVGKGQR